MTTGRLSQRDPSEQSLPGEVARDLLAERLMVSAPDYAKQMREYLDAYKHQHPLPQTPSVSYHNTHSHPHPPVSNHQHRYAGAMEPWHIVPFDTEGQGQTQSQPNQFAYKSLEQLPLVSCRQESPIRADHEYIGTKGSRHCKNCGTLHPSVWREAEQRLVAGAHSHAWWWDETVAASEERRRKQEEVNSYVNKEVAAYFALKDRVTNATNILDVTLS